MKKNAFVNKKYCVACGTCVASCPKGAIKIPYGVQAKVDFEACVGCGKCVKVYLGDTIILRERNMNHEKYEGCK